MISDQEKLSALLQIYNGKCFSFSDFQQKYIEQLNIEYNPIRHNANVILLSAFCAHCLLGFNGPNAYLRSIFLQNIINQQSDEIQKYIYTYGQHIDHSYLKSFRLLLQKKSLFAMGDAIYEQLLLCNEHYDPGIDIRPRDILCIFEAETFFTDFLMSHQDFAKSLQEL